MSVPPDDLDRLYEAVLRFARKRFPHLAVSEVQIRFANGPPWRSPVPVCACGDPPGENGNAGAGGTPPPGRAHSPDFRSVSWDGTLHTFSPLQAAVVRELWQAWEQGTPEVSQDYLLEKAGSVGRRLFDVFRRHPAWGTLITPGSHPGTYRLAP